MSLPTSAFTCCPTHWPKLGGGVKVGIGPGAGWGPGSGGLPNDGMGTGGGGGCAAGEVKSLLYWSRKLGGCAGCGKPGCGGG